MFCPFWRLVVMWQVVSSRLFGRLHIKLKNWINIRLTICSKELWQFISQKLL